jgi:transposase
VVSLLDKIPLITKYYKLHAKYVPIIIGHKDFVTIATTRVDGKTNILAPREDRKKDTVKKFLKTIPKKLRKTIKAVCSDMYEGFIKAAFEY